MTKKPANFVLAVAAFMAGANAMTAPFHLSAPLGDEWFSNNTDFVSTWSDAFNITSSYLGGFSSGACLTSKMVQLGNDTWIDAAGILSGFIFPGHDLEPIENITNMHIFMYHGTNDTIVSSEAFHQTVQRFKDDNAFVHVQEPSGFAHVMPTNLPINEWNPVHTCTDLTFDPPYVSAIKNCGYNMAYFMLEHLVIDQIMPRVLTPKDYGDFHAFNQTPFTGGDPDAKMGDIGYIYIPHTCKAGNYCMSMMFLHGCQEGAGWWKDTEARRTGLLEYAATNNIVVVFPQNNDSAEVQSLNVTWKYCWSSVNATDSSNAQITTLRNMQESLFHGSNNTSSLSLTDPLTPMTPADVSASMNAKKSENRKAKEAYYADTWIPQDTGPDQQFLQK